MDTRLRDLVVEVGGDPTDPIWEWLVCRGPHGSTFTWNASKTNPPGYIGVEHLREIVSENSDMDAHFPDKARQAALAALRSTSSDLIRRAVQVLAVVGTAADVTELQALASHSAAAVAKDARAALFELKRVTLRPR